MVISAISVLASLSSYLEWLTIRVGEGRMLTWHELTHDLRMLVVLGYRMEVTPLEAIAFFALIMGGLMLVCYFIGTGAGYEQGKYDTDVEWSESIERHWKRLKKYGFGDEEANDWSAVKTYKEMKDRRRRDDV